MANFSAPPTRVAVSVSTSRCDVCSVTRESVGGVLIHFGERKPSALAPREVAVALRHRVSLGEGTAARLQDLMTALLNEPPVSRDGVR